MCCIQFERVYFEFQLVLSHRPGNPVAAAPVLYMRKMTVQGEFLSFKLWDLQNETTLSVTTVTIRSEAGTTWFCLTHACNPGAKEPFIKLMNLACCTFLLLFLLHPPFSSSPGTNRHNNYHPLRRCVTKDTPLKVAGPPSLAKSCHTFSTIMFLTDTQIFNATSCTYSVDADEWRASAATQTLQCQNHIRRLHQHLQITPGAAVPKCVTGGSDVISGMKP